jgi:hypothetical protein
MHRVLELALAVVLTAGTTIAAPQPARAQSSWLTVTNCELVTIDGHEYGKLTFDVKNPDGGVIDLITLRPIAGPSPADTCHLKQVTLPPFWVSHLDPSGIRLWGTDYEHSVPAGGTLSGIQIVLSQPTCCYALRFPGPLLGDPYPEWPVCFRCPGATPANESSWGTVKSRYR